MADAILSFVEKHRIARYRIAPGEPMRNGRIESFNGQMRSGSRQSDLKRPGTGHLCYDPVSFSRPAV
ncbi:MAG: transposase [Pseudorhodoplanes sp.]|nr:transposase [Pseudorhodoplanes sp.]